MHIRRSPIKSRHTARKVEIGWGETKNTHIPDWCYRRVGDSEYSEVYNDELRGVPLLVLAFLYRTSKLTLVSATALPNL